MRAAGSSLCGRGGERFAGGRGTSALGTGPDPAPALWVVFRTSTETGDPPVPSWGHSTTLNWVADEEPPVALHLMMQESCPGSPSLPPLWEAPLSPNSSPSLALPLPDPFAQIHHILQSCFLPLMSLHESDPMLSATEDQAGSCSWPPCLGTLMYHKEQGGSLGSANLIIPQRSASKWHLQPWELTCSFKAGAELCHGG